MLILGIETTCDETAVGIVEDGRKVLSNVVASSAQLFEKYGGIVPEVAAREQTRLIVPVIAEALRLAGVNISKVNAISVANGPGLIGSLLVGVEAAKTLALALDIPLIAVNHLIGHVYANWLFENAPDFPVVALIVSGGHTDLIYMENFKKYYFLGGTRDDAAGEVFDKVARVLGLGYPGGPEIEKLAKEWTGAESGLSFPRPMIDSTDFDFSFSGLKTAVVNEVVRKKVQRKDAIRIAFEFQNSVVDVLVKKTLKAAKKKGAKSIVVGGGVAANSYLRKRMKEKVSGAFKVFFPEKSYSVDNGAMIAAASYFVNQTVDPLKLQANPSLHF